MTRGSSSATRACEWENGFDESETGALYCHFEKVEMRQSASFMWVSESSSSLESPLLNWRTGDRRRERKRVKELVISFFAKI